MLDRILALIDKHSLENRQHSIRFTTEQIAFLDGLSKKTGLSSSEVIRIIVDEFLNEFSADEIKQISLGYEKKKTGFLRPVKLKNTQIKEIKLIQKQTKMSFALVIRTIINKALEISEKDKKGISK